MAKAKRPATEALLNHRPGATLGAKRQSVVPSSVIESGFELEKQRSDTALSELIGRKFSSPETKKRRLANKR